MRLTLTGDHKTFSYENRKEYDREIRKLKIYGPISLVKEKRLYESKIQELKK